MSTEFRIISYILCNQGSLGNKLMQVVSLIAFSVIGMGVVTALSAALYAALPRYFLECAELHGRFHGLRRDDAIQNGTPTEALPEGLVGHAA